jgi:hypothetical protein
MQPSEASTLAISKQLPNHMEPTVWHRYRKTFLYSQIFIAFVTTAIAWQTCGLSQSAVVFVVMQVANVAGAWWGERLQRNVAAASLNSQL